MSTTPPVVVEMGETQQHKQQSPVKVEGGVVASELARAAGGTEEVVPLKAEQLTASKQAVVGAMEAAGVVSQRKREELVIFQ